MRKNTFTVLLTMLLAVTVPACGNKPAEPEATSTDGSAAADASEEAAPSAANAKNLRNYLKGTWKVDSVEGIEAGIIQDVEGKVTFTGSACDLMKSGNNPLSIEAASESVSFGNGETIDGRITIADKAGNVTFDVNAIDGDNMELRQGDTAVIKLSRTSADVVVKGGGQASQQQGQPQQDKNKESVVGGYLIGDWETPDGRRVTFDGTYTNYISDDAAWPYIVSDDEYTIEIMPKEGDHEIFWVRIEDDDYIRLSRDGNRVYLTRLSHTPTKPEEGTPEKPEKEDDKKEEEDKKEEDKKEEAENTEEEAKKEEEEAKKEEEAEEPKAEDEETAEEEEKTDVKSEEPAPEETPQEKGSEKDGNYRLISEAVTWDAAKAACEAMGGHLVTIESSGELARVKDILAGSNLHTAWIGLYRGSGSWTWVTGKGLTYTNWAPDSPSADGGNFAEIIVDAGDGAHGSVGQWNNSPSEGGSGFYSLETKGYICEFD